MVMKCARVLGCRGWGRADLILTEDGRPYLESWEDDLPPDPNMTPAQKAEADEVEHAIQHCLNNLPLEFKTVVVMADIQGMDYTEVAAAVRVPLGTIKSRLARARLRLRECLQGFAELLPASYRLDDGIKAS